MRVIFISTLFLGLLLDVAKSDNGITPQNLPKAEAVHVEPSEREGKEGYKHNPLYLVVTCMDYRVPDEIVRFLENRGLKDQYDLIALPGASLGAVHDVDHDSSLSWSKVFLNMLKIAVDLHHIKAIIVIDHRDCGMYKAINDPSEYTKDRQSETDFHRDSLKQFQKLVHQQYPHILVESLLIDLDGKFETISKFTDASGAYFPPSQ